ncbi:MAG: DEAD/DEAH box helicase, partial [Candidatus Binatia bacterium]
GVETIGQRFEKSFWHRLAAHCFRELGDVGTFRPGIDEASGDFSLTHQRSDGTETVRVVVPRSQVRQILGILAEAFPDAPDLAVHPIPLRTLFHVSGMTELDAVEVRPVIEALQAQGERAYLDGEELERFRYGSLVWVKELGVLAELERPGENRRFSTPARVTLRRHQIPGFLEAVGEEAVIGEGGVAGLRVLHDWDALEIVPQVEGESPFRVKIGCDFDGAVVPLGDLLDARRRGAPYVDTAKGWVKLDAPALARIDAAFSRSPTARLEGEIAHLSAADLFRLGAAGAGALRIAGDPLRSTWLRRLLALRPTRPWSRPAGLASELRDYQVRGVEWLRFLAENGLSGLLCDDMGLGKTHQAMALMASLRGDGATDPSLVVCPTTVIGHWRDKLARYAPGLRAAVHHGAGRNLDEALADADVVITSYGILRNDVELFAARRFALAVFDEIQQAKNRETLAHEAIRRIDAGIRVGLTGTPVENR